MGLSVTLKAGRGNAQVAVGSCGSVVRAPEAKQDGLSAALLVLTQIG